MNSRVLLLTGLAALVAVVAAVVVFLLVGADDEPTTAPAPTTSADLPQPCPNSAIVYFDTDEAMRQGADVLRGDSRLAEVEQQTKQQAYVRFREVFADQPELLDRIQPDTLPSSLYVTGSGAINKQDLLAELKARFPGLEVNDACDPRAPSAGPAPTSR
ncbi:MAG: permease-like cell division protein FtsX [Kibdelosporangium sp.]